MKKTSQGEQKVLTLTKSKSKMGYFTKAWLAC